MIPGSIHLSMIGFEGNGGYQYSLNFIEFGKYLEGAYKFITPTFSEVNPSENFIKYFIRYRVERSATKPKPYETLIANAIFSEYEKGNIARGAIASLPVNEIVTAFFSDGYHTAFGTNANQFHDSEYAVMIANPCMDRIKENLLELSSHLSSSEKDILQSLLGYHWLYNGIPTNTWISSENFAIIDVTSHSVYIGPTSSSFGVRNPLSVPRLADFPDFKRNRNVLFEASLGGVIYSLASHVFYPNVGFAPYTSTWNQVFVPVIVFKNHGLHVELDEKTIHQQLRKVFPDSIKLDVKFGTHSLHDHKHVSMAVSKSLRTHIVHELDENGSYVSRGLQYLDSKTLTVELRRSADALAGLLLDNAVPGVSNKVVLPVYIFSLHGYESDFLLDGHEIVSADHDSVVVLVTEHENVPLPMIINTENVFINATSPTRHVISGVAMSQGLVPPYQKYSLLEEREEYDYSWALGEHPFGPFSSSTSLSELFVRNLRRNAVLSRVHKGVSIIRDTVVLIDQFAEKYLHGVLESADDVSSWLDAVYHGITPENDPLLYTETVDRLHSEILELSYQLGTIKDLLRQFKNDEAFSQSQSFIFKANLIHEYAKQEIETAEIRLQCCRIHHTPPSNILYYAIIALTLSTIAIFAPLFFVFGYFIFRKVNKNARVRPADKLSKTLLG